MAQKLLKQWYGINYEPKILPENQQQIELLENSAPGAKFDVNFMTVLSRHHFTIIRRAYACLVSSDLNHLHASLERYCRDIVNSQLSDIDEMRHLLCNRFHICDYQPLKDPQGSFTQPYGAWGDLGNMLGLSPISCCEVYTNGVSATQLSHPPFFGSRCETDLRS